MSIELTTQQLQALDAGGETPPRVVDPRNHEAYVLIPVPEYEAVREILDEEKRQNAIRAVGLVNAARRMESEP